MPPSMEAESPTNATTNGMRTRTFPVCRRYPIQLYMTGNITPASMQSATSENGIAPALPCVRTAIRQSAVRSKNAAAGQTIPGSSMFTTHTSVHAMVKT